MGFGGATDTKTYFDDQVASADLLNGSGTQGALLVGTTPVLVQVSGSPLSGRKSVTLFNNSNATMYWGWSNSVTTSTGTPIFKNQMMTWTVGENITIYVVAGSINNDARITEAS